MGEFIDCLDFDERKVWEGDLDDIVGVGKILGVCVGIWLYVGLDLGVSGIELFEVCVVEFFCLIVWVGIDGIGDFWRDVL